MWERLSGECNVRWPLQVRALEDVAKCTEVCNVLMDKTDVKRMSDLFAAYYRMHASVDSLPLGDVFIPYDVYAATDQGDNNLLDSSEVELGITKTLGYNRRDETGLGGVFYNHVSLTMVYHRVGESLDDGVQVVRVLPTLQSVDYARTNAPQACDRNFVRDIPPLVLRKEPAEVLYTYDVVWKESEVLTPAARWEPYVSVEHEHVLDMTNSLVVFSLLVCAMLFRLADLRRQLAEQSELVFDMLDEHEPGQAWQFLINDVERCPPKARPLAVAVGTGAQCAATAFVVLVMASAGLAPPGRTNGRLLAAIVVTYQVMTLVGAAVAHRLLFQWRGARYSRRVAFLVPLVLPAIVYIWFCVLQVVYHAHGSSKAVGGDTFAVLLFLWLLISLPLAYAAGLVSSKSARPAAAAPVSLVPRVIPVDARKCVPMRHFFVLLPAACWVIEVHFMMRAVFFDELYPTFSFALIKLVLYAAVLSLCAIFHAHSYFVREDYHWHWRAFRVGLAHGGILVSYLGFFAMANLAVDSVGTGLFVAHGLLLALVFAAMSGAIAFLAVRVYVWWLYSALHERRRAEDRSGVQLAAAVRLRSEVPSEDWVGEHDSDEDEPNL